MTTNKPEVVAYYHTNKENPEHRGVSLHHDASCTNTLINTEPLIRLSDYEALQAECDALVEESISVTYVDGVGAGRRSLSDCRDGVSYITVADTIYWPLSEDDAQLLRSAECGRGEFTGPTSPECTTSKDAERYRWLKKSAFCNVWERGDGVALVVPRATMATIDSRIDADRRKGGSDNE